MKKLLIILFCLGTFQVYAQNSKITTGVLAEQQNNFGDAIAKLNEAFANKDLITKPQLLPKGYYALYKSYFRVAVDTTLKDLRTQYPNASYLAYEAFENAMATDVKEAYHKQAILDGAEANIWAVLYNEGVAFFNGNQDDKAVQYFEAADKISPGDFYTARMLGSVKLVKADTAAAVKSLENSAELFKTKFFNRDTEGFKETPEYTQAAGQASYVYQQLAVVYQAQGNVRKALDLLTAGSEMLPKDESIKRLELAIYQQHPELFAEAEKKFQEAIAKTPDDLDMKVAYAGLLERADRLPEALKIYQEVYDKDPNNLSANYGLGASYVNTAAEISQRKMKMTRDADIDAADAEIVELLKKAYPYMLWLHNAQPKEVEWLRQLVTIAPFIGKEDEMVKFSTELRALSN